MISRKLEVLARACEAIDRDVGDIEVTVSTRLEDGDTPDRFAAKCHALAGYGIEHAIVISNGPWTTDRLDVLAAASARLQAA